MRTNRKATKLAATGALAMLIATGAFAADQRNQFRSGNDRWQQQPPAQGPTQDYGRSQYDRGQYDRGQNDRGQYDRGQYDRAREQRDHVRGVITRVDYRDGFALVRVSGTRQQVRVDIGRQHLRRGDFVTLEGRWDRGMFAAYRIEGR